MYEGSWAVVVCSKIGKGSVKQPRQMAGHVVNCTAAATGCLCCGFHIELGIHSSRDSHGRRHQTAHSIARSADVVLDAGDLSGARSQEAQS
jgi:hypothetical protein